jgi:hypothetical protein
MRKKVEAVCETCKSVFYKAESEYKRNLRLARKNYCSLSCAGKKNYINLPDHETSKSYVIAKHAGNKKDSMSDFREHLRRCKRRGHVVDITLEDLNIQWEIQRGTCPYTGLKLLQPKYNSRNDIQTTASLDRIDCSKGYIKGNIQFVSMAINYAKSTLTHEEMLTLCRTIANYWMHKS